jgi:ubiquinone/menaquinone biosynthesis C-methylase UbiE
MKIRNPASRSKLKIPANALVLDVGSGHNPHPRANVLADKFIDSNFHRASDIKVLKGQKFVEADGQSLPFADKEFDYVICCHVAEHVEDPASFLNELSRVGKSGYLEVPSLVGEFLIPKRSHIWTVLEINNKLVFVKKERLGFNANLDFGDVFLKFLPTSSVGFKILQRTHFQLLTVNYEWKDSIDYSIEPTDEELMKYFKEPWNQEMFQRMIVKRPMGKEVMASMGAMVDIFKSVVKSRFLSKF